MALLITPGQLSSRSELFHQLGQVTASGLGLISALQILQRNPPRESLRRPVGELLRQLQDGESFGASLERSGQWLSAFDIALLQAAEKSGRLPDCFRTLSGYYAQQATLARSVLGFIAYPLIVLHVGILVFPIERLTDLVLKGAFSAFVLQKLAVLLPIYGVAAFALFALQGTRGEPWRALVERVLGLVPVLGRARRQLAVSRLCLALEALISAGVGVVSAWPLAAAASGSPALRRFVTRALPQMEAGRTPSELVGASAEFPPVFATLYATGELSGTLDESLKRGHVQFLEEGQRQTKQFIFALAGLFMAIVMLAIAWNIISFYLGYFQRINDAINMNAK